MVCKARRKPSMTLFDGLERRFSREDHSVDPIEPGRPAKAVSTSTL